MFPENEIDFSSHGVVVLIENGGKFLMIKEARELLNGHWGPPHGRSEITDQKEEDIVVRETKEETNLNVTPIRKIITIPADTKVKTVSFWLAKVVGTPDIKIDSTEASEYGWFTQNEIMKLPLYPGTKLVFDEIISGKLNIS